MKLHVWKGIRRKIAGTDNIQHWHIQQLMRHKKQEVNTRKLTQGRGCIIMKKKINTNR